MGASPPICTLTSSFTEGKDESSEATKTGSKLMKAFRASMQCVHWNKNVGYAAIHSQVHPSAQALVGHVNSA